MLRDYQSDICSRVQDALRKHRSVMVQMPTGTGKTIVLAQLVNNEKLYSNEELGVRNEECILIVAHRRELVEQIQETIRRMGIERPGISVCSIQWLAHNINKVGVTPSLVVIDEAHHALARTYRMMWEAFPKAKFLGLTATPCRMNRVGFTDLFEVLVCSHSISWFIRKRWLSLFDYYSIKSDSEDQMLIDSLEKRGADGDYQTKELNAVLNRRPSIGRLYDSVCRYADGKKGIVYAVSIDHAHNIADYYRNHGIEAVAIDSRTPADVRKRTVEDFKDGQIRVMVSVDLFSEGFDCPDVEFIQLARPTLSLAKYLQMVGRGLRKSKGKMSCVMIDNVGLYRMFGLPAADRDWNAMFKGRLAGKGDRVKGNVVNQYAMNVCREDECSRDADIEKVIDHLCLRKELEQNRKVKRTVIEGFDMNKVKVVDRGFYVYFFFSSYDRAWFDAVKSIGRQGSLFSACTLANEDSGWYFFLLRLDDGNIIVMDQKLRYYYVEDGKEKVYIGCEDSEEEKKQLLAVIKELRQKAKKRYLRFEGEKLKAEMKKLRDVEPFCVNDKWGLRLAGRVVVPPIYRSMKHPVGNFCAVEVSPQRWGVIQINGKTVVNACYQGVDIRQNGVAVLTVFQGKNIKVKLGVRINE